MQLEAVTKLQQTNSLRSQSSKVDSEVDSAWSQAQQYETDRSASVRKEEIINENSVRSSCSNSVSNPQCDDFYNPMPTRQFSKNYEPSLLFGKDSPEITELQKSMFKISPKPGIENRDEMLKKQKCTHL